jgi:hypothetical protein
VIDSDVRGSNLDTGEPFGESGERPRLSATCPPTHLAVASQREAVEAMRRDLSHPGPLRFNPTCRFNPGPFVLTGVSRGGLAA